MHLYLMRHGDAEFSSATGGDANRRLSDWGKLQVAAMGAAMRRAGCKPEAIICSNFVRAVETADIMARELEFTGKVSHSKLLVPSTGRDEINALVQKHSGLDSLMLIGHMPSMGDFVGSLLGDHVSFGMPTAAIAAVRIESMRGAMHGTLEWYVTPEILK